MTAKRRMAYLMLPLARCRSLLNPAVISLERVDLSCSTLIVARALELAGDKVPSNLLILPATLGAPDL